MPLTDDQLLERFNTRRPPTGILFKSHVLEVRSADGFVRMSYDIGAEYTNPGGSVQGGIVTALLDDTAAFAAIVKAGQPVFVATLELKTTFFAAAKPGLLYAEARVIKLGKTIGFIEADLIDPEGKLLARMTTTTAPRLLDRPANLIAGGVDNSRGDKQ
ncbi:MAG: PaaI family thioesterase [Pseudomonadota bacterium]